MSVRVEMIERLSSMKINPNGRVMLHVHVDTDTVTDEEMDALAVLVKDTASGLMDEDGDIAVIVTSPDIEIAVIENITEFISSRYSPRDG